MREEGGGVVNGKKNRLHRGDLKRVWKSSPKTQNSVLINVILNPYDLLLNMKNKISTIKVIHMILVLYFQSSNAICYLYVKKRLKIKWLSTSMEHKRCFEEYFMSKQCKKLDITEFLCLFNVHFSKCHLLCSSEDSKSHTMSKSDGRWLSCSSTCRAWR